MGGVVCLLGVSRNRRGGSGRCGAGGAAAGSGLRRLGGHHVRLDPRRLRREVGWAVRAGTGGGGCCVAEARGGRDMAKGIAKAVALLGNFGDFRASLVILSLQRGNLVRKRRDELHDDSAPVDNCKAVFLVSLGLLCPESLARN